MSPDDVSTNKLRETKITCSNDIKIPGSIHEVLFTEGRGPVHAIWYIHQTGSTEYLYITDRKNMGGDREYMGATKVREPGGGAESRVEVPKKVRQRKNLGSEQTLYFYLREGEKNEEDPSTPILTEEEMYSFLDNGINNSSETVFTQRFSAMSPFSDDDL